MGVLVLGTCFLPGCINDRQTNQTRWFERDYWRKPKEYRLGKLKEFLYDQAFQREFSFLVVRDKQGWGTMDARCTYNGCDLSYNSTVFVCPCCQSVFSHQGQVLRGPATRDLPWYNMSYRDNQLFVEVGQKVAPSFRFTQPDIESAIKKLNLTVGQENDIEIIPVSRELMGDDSGLKGLTRGGDYKQAGLNDRFKQQLIDQGVDYKKLTR